MVHESIHCLAYERFHVGEVFVLPVVFPLLAHVLVRGEFDVDIVRYEQFASDECGPIMRGRYVVILAHPCHDAFEEGFDFAHVVHVQQEVSVHDDGRVLGFLGFLGFLGESHVGNTSRIRSDPLTVGPNLVNFLNFFLTTVLPKWAPNWHFVRLS